MKIEWIRVSAVVHSTEDREKVGEAIATLFPFEFEIYVNKARGHYGNPIEYLEVELTKKKEIDGFWKNLMKSLGDQRKELVENIDERINGQNVLHIRIDKQRAYFGEIKLSEGGDSIVIKAKIVTYPAKRDKVIEAAKTLCTTS